jgi:hypothetical protein
MALLLGEPLDPTGDLLEGHHLADRARHVQPSCDDECDELIQVFLPIAEVPEQGMGFHAEIGAWTKGERLLKEPDHHDSTVEELLAQRGIVLTYETIRQWCLKFGQPSANEWRRRCPGCGDTWHLDEMVLTIHGKKHSLWRAVETDGNVFDRYHTEFCVMA